MEEKGEESGFITVKNYYHLGCRSHFPTREANLMRIRIWKRVFDKMVLQISRQMLFVVLRSRRDEGWWDEGGKGWRDELVKWWSGGGMTGWRGEGIARFARVDGAGEGKVKVRVRRPFQCKKLNVCASSLFFSVAHSIRTSNSWQSKISFFVKTLLNSMR